jgi:predicted GNAT family N-acyltransferase
MTSSPPTDGTPRRSNRPVVTMKLVSTSDELLQCYALRAAVFMGEQQCPYWEEFDGNDYSASHLMLYVDGEPAASMRVRWFSGFAKLERAIILKRYRSMGLFLPFVDWAKEFARKKGYPRAYLHGQRRLWKIFERNGFHMVDDRPFHFSDHEYGAFACDLAVGADGPTVHSDPMVLNRPEDQLDRPGILEDSMERGASNPHADWTERRMN